MSRSILAPVPLEIRGPGLLCVAFKAMLSASVRPKHIQDPTFVTLLLDESSRQWGSEASPEEIERCVFVTRGDLSELHAATRLGIQVFVGFEDEPDVLSEAVSAAAACESYCSRTLLPRLLKALREGVPTENAIVSEVAGAAMLSEREREIAHLVAAGGSNEQVAERLFVSVATVKFHLGNVYRKLGISRRGQLFAALPGLVPPSAPRSNGSSFRLPMQGRLADAYASDAFRREAQ